MAWLMLNLSKTVELIMSNTHHRSEKVVYDRIMHMGVDGCTLDYERSLFGHFGRAGDGGASGFDGHGTFGGEHVD